MQVAVIIIIIITIEKRLKRATDGVWTVWCGCITLWELNGFWVLFSCLLSGNYQVLGSGLEILVCIRLINPAEPAARHELMFLFFLFIFLNSYNFCYGFPTATTNTNSWPLVKLISNIFVERGGREGKRLQMRLIQLFRHYFACGPPDIIFTDRFSLIWSRDCGWWSSLSASFSLSLSLSYATHHFSFRWTCLAQ